VDPLHWPTFTAKSAAFLPETVAAPMVTLAVPVLVMVKEFVALIPIFEIPRSMDVGVTASVFTTLWPVPSKSTVCALPPALLAIWSKAERSPGFKGAKPIVTLQDA
jgi:hypothetical protein